MRECVVIASEFVYHYVKKGTSVEQAMDERVCCYNRINRDIKTIHQQKYK
jgi:hypothetical protein